MNIKKVNPKKCGRRTTAFKAREKKIDKKYEKNSIKKAKNFRFMEEKIHFFARGKNARTLFMIYLWQVFVFRCVFFCWLGMLMLQFEFIRAVVHIMNSMKSNFLLWLHAHSLTRLLCSSKTITSNVVQQVDAHN